MENSKVMFLWTRFQHHTFAAATLILGGHILVMIIHLQQKCAATSSFLHWHLKRLQVLHLIGLKISFTPYNHNCRKCSVSAGRHFGFMQIKHFLRLSQIWTPSIDQENVLGEVYVKTGGPTMDIAKGIQVCNQLVRRYEG